jgi:uroporphyrin-III C-methyltransferase
MTVALVGAGPGDPELITVRGLALVRACEVLVYDRLIGAPLVEETPPNTVRIPRDGLTQNEVNSLLIAHGRRSGVVRLKGGDPFIFGRGGEEALALAHAGVPCEVVPGVSALSSVPAAVGIPVTHRGAASLVTAFAAHDVEALDVTTLARVRGTLVAFMGLAGLERLVERLVAAGIASSTPAAVVTSGTTDEQRSVSAPLGALPGAAAGLQTPALVVIGEVVAFGDKLREARRSAA